ncbi:hypothetical protein OUZ56_013343 [Daphnia magna]|uniref:Uncharacterized protein n=1 Tax=Daphnia magna TaxID=35525 RepID=A0ABQ9Z5P0_9CRUS|nr:hypothetical protein OUZ56_013343 [Daphnia magna]
MQNCRPVRLSSVNLSSTKSSRGAKFKTFKKHMTYGRYTRSADDDTPPWQQHLTQHQEGRKLGSTFSPFPTADADLAGGDLLVFFLFVYSSGALHHVGEYHQVEIRRKKKKL